MKNVIGMGSLKTDPALVDFAWIGDNGACGQYREFSTFTQLRNYLEAHGYRHLMLVFYGEDFAVFAPAPAWQPSA